MTRVFTTYIDFSSFPPPSVQWGKKVRIKRERKQVDGGSGGRKGGTKDNSETKNEKKSKNYNFQNPKQNNNILIKKINECFHLISNFKTKSHDRKANLI